MQSTHTLLCSSSTALLSPLISLIEEIEPEPAVRVGLVDALLAGLFVALARLARGPVDPVLFTSPLTEARGRGAADADSGETTEVRVAEDAVVAGLAAVEADSVDLAPVGVGAFPPVGVGALGAIDWRRAAVVADAETPVGPCLGGIDDLA